VNKLRLYHARTAGFVQEKMAKNKKKQEKHQKLGELKKEEMLIELWQL
jgi:hypothetical protein